MLIAVDTALRLVDNNPNDSVTSLFALAIVYVAAELGVVPGLLCASLCFGFFLSYVAIDSVDVGFLGYLGRFVGFMAPALVIGPLATKLRLARDEARQDEERISSLIASTIEAMVSTDADQRIVAWNPAAARLFGWSAEEALGRQVVELTMPERLRPLYQASLARFLQTGDRSMLDRRLEFRGRHRDGHEFPVEVTVAAVETGEGWTFHGFVHDITERRAEKEALARLAATVEASRDAIVTTTLEGEITDWNRGAERLYGYTAGEAIGMSIYQLHPPDQGDPGILEKVRRGESVDDLDTERIGKTGRCVDVSVSVFPLRDPEGEVVAATSITRDISSRRRAARYLEAQFRVARILAETTDMARVGPQALQVVAEAGSWAGGAYWSMQGDGSQVRCDATWSAPDGPGVEIQIEEGAVFDLDPRLRDPVWLASQTAPGVAPSPLAASSNLFGASAWVPIGPGGETFGAFELVDRRSRDGDPELMAAIFAIANQVAGRIERRRAAEAAERAKDEFFALVSHELRTPLTSVIGYVDLLADAEADRLSEQGRQFLEVVRRNAQRQLRLVGDLLLLVRIQEGSFDVELGTADLREVVEQAVETNRPAAAKRRITLSCESDPVPGCVGDPHRLMQVVDNLLTNAIKFTPKDGRVDVRVGSQNGTATIEVEDSGVGIPEDELNRLFERLYRASTATAAQISGLGLGLTIAKAIVDAHGGTIGVESVEGAGTRFRVELPLGGQRT